MKYILTVLMTVVMAVATMGCACMKCSSKGSCETKSYCATEKSCCCEKALKGLKLSDEQKAKVDAIMSACSKAECTPEACEKTSGQIKDVLNDEQKAAYEKAMAKMADKKGCARSKKSCD